MCGRYQNVNVNDPLNWGLDIIPTHSLSIYSLLYLNILVQIGAATLICFFFIVNPVVTLLIALMLIFIDVWLFGMVGICTLEFRHSICILCI